MEVGQDDAMLQKLKFEMNQRSDWFLGVVALRGLDSLCNLIEPINIFGVIIGLFITYRLWQRNRFWRNVSVYIGIPLSLLLGLYNINEYDYSGEFIVIEVFIYLILFAKSWNEFTYTDKV